MGNFRRLCTKALAFGANTVERTEHINECNLFSCRSITHWIIQIVELALDQPSLVWYWTPVEGEDTALVLKPDDIQDQVFVNVFTVIVGRRQMDE